MNIKRTLLILLSRVIRGAGMGLGASGIALAGWFFFSVNEYKFLWGLLSFVEFGGVSDISICICIYL